MSNLFRKIPAVNELLEKEPLQRLSDRVSRTVVVSGVREFLDRLRTDVSSAASEIPTPAELAERIAAWIAQAEQPALCPVINATGIVLHTGLGRAPLAAEAIEAIARIGSGYASVEVDLAEAKRSERTQAVEKNLRRLTGAPAATVVNNNAGATFLALTAIGRGREVIVSRGQLVEIGGSFRLPEVMESGGVRLREVGTTNKTRIEDYAKAISDETAALMRVHTSNYVIRGFTQDVGIEELVALGRERSLPVIDDVGSGALWDFSKYGVEGEPLVADSVRAGADVVLFSGDKLLGGPQCGIIVGTWETVEAIKRHPLARALRVDKVTLAALDATLQLYLDPEKAEQRLPLLRLLSTPLENLRFRAEQMAPQIAATEGVASAEVVESAAYLGGGSVPGQEIPTYCIAVTPASGSVDELSRRLRTATPAVYGRIQQDRLLIDLRTVFVDQDQRILEAFEGLGNEKA